MTSAQQARPRLAGNYAPVGEELTAYDLPMTGRIPDELAGWYLRIGPNPADAALPPDTGSSATA